MTARPITGEAAEKRPVGRRWVGGMEFDQITRRHACPAGLVRLVVGQRHLLGPPMNFFWYGRDG